MEEKINGSVPVRRHYNASGKEGQKEDMRQIPIKRHCSRSGKERLKKDVG